MRLSIISGLLSIGMMAVSCSESGLEAPREPGAPNSEAVSVALSSVSVPAPVEAYSATPGTRSSAEIPEATVDGRLHDLWAIQYDESGNLVGTPYYTADIPEGTAATPGSGLDYSHSGLSLKLTSSGAKAHTVYFVGNTGNGSLFTVDNSDISKADKLAAAVHRYGSEYKPNAASGIVMLGAYTGPVASGTPITGIRIERLAAKVLLKYKIDPGFSGFTVTGVQMKNVPSVFRFDPAPAAVFPASGADSHIDYPAEDVSKAGAEGDYKTFTWYMPENLRGVNSGVIAIGDRTPDKSDGKAAYVEVTGLIRESDRCRKATYRILLGDPSAAMGDFNVKRNTVYTVTLDIQGMNAGDNRVTVESYDMSNSAMILPGGADSVVFDIRKCLNNGFTMQSDLNALMTASSVLTADVLWQDAQNVLTTADVKLDKVNGLLTVKSSKATEGNAVIALYPNADKKQGEILWSWHVWVTAYKPDEAGVSTRAANTAYPVTSGQVHTYGTEFQKANGSSRVIMDRNLGAMKTYYAAPAAGDGSADQSFGMFYQWGRKDPFPPGDASTINTSTGTAKTIPIYDADGVVLAEGAKDDITAKGLKTVTRPFPITIENGTALAYSIKNPLIYISARPVTSDWYTYEVANQNDALWGDGAPKSAYDPCPTGWRIAPAGTWSDFTRDEGMPLNGTFPYYMNGTMTETGDICYATNGRLYKNFVWYPAQGQRPDTGGLLVVGNGGYCMSSRMIMRDGAGKQMYMNLSFKTVYPDNSTFPAYGLQTRCIQE